MALLLSGLKKSFKVNVSVIVGKSLGHELVKVIILLVLDEYGDITNLPSPKTRLLIPVEVFFTVTGVMPLYPSSPTLWTNFTNTPAVSVSENVIPTSAPSI